MEKLSISKIRKISIGENPIAERGKVLTIEIGQKFRLGSNNVTVSGIIVDESSFYFYGNIRYCIYVIKEDNTEVLWKMFERVPISIECEI